MGREKKCEKWLKKLKMTAFLAVLHGYLLKKGLYFGKKFEKMRANARKKTKNARKDTWKVHGSGKNERFLAVISGYTLVV